MVAGLLPANSIYGGYADVGFQWNALADLISLECFARAETASITAVLITQFDNL